MKMRYKTGVILAAFILAFVKIIHAEEVELDKIIVTASRVSEGIKGTTASVSVFDKEEIENNNEAEVKDIITGALAADVVQTGSFGGLTSVFLRGTSPGQSRIMIDNVRVCDPIATDSSFNLAHLASSSIERIEVVRGPQSVLYGSDAMGGVINFITKKGEGKPGISVSLSDGTYDSRNAVLESGGKIGAFSYALTASRYYSRGISKLIDTSERDSYDRTSLSLRSEYDIGAESAIGIISHFINANYEYDDSFNLRDDPSLRGRDKQLTFSGFWDSRLNDFWKQKLQLSYMGNFRRHSDDREIEFPDDYLRDWYKGESYQIDWQHTLKPFKCDTIVSGFDWQRESGQYYYFSSYTFLGAPFSYETRFPNVHSSTRGWYLENLFNPNDRFTLNAGIRVDDHSYAGLKRTYKIDASYLFESDTKIKGGWGSAYKAPTLYQLHAEAVPFVFGGGNKNLQPEESQTYEAGFEQALFQDKLSFASVFFHTQLKNLIDAKYDPVTFFTPAYSNIGKAVVFGYENTLAVKPFTWLKIDAGYTWQDTQDRSNGDELLRRPKNKAFLNFAYNPIPDLDLGLKLVYVGRRQDVGNILLRSYTKLDLNINYRFNKNLEAFFKIDNLNDEKYKEVFNYAEPGRVFNAGIKASF